MTSEPVAMLIEDFPVTIRIPVWWGDQDAFGHVNNTIFLRWFESARIAYTTKLGLPELYQTRRIGPILASLTCHFRRQIRFPDEVDVGARIDRIGRTSLTMSHIVVSREGRAVAAEGTSTIVLFDYENHQPVPVPDEIRVLLREIEGERLAEG